ncbi:MAG: HAMP domain-containing histidine kinase [Nitrospirae bacterium]|uniref:histidine kinase n=1 Tax=uncultured Nitrospirota bacterium TaxID=170969 RepID=A0A142BTY7_9BACT|nr:signal transduction histidine kinase [uncultured Nitrospirota bacterium]MBF0343170.1 HAMP domain-containing histidine kinase [Nitrospirota bacterium]
MSDDVKTPQSDLDSLVKSNTGCEKTIEMQLSEDGQILRLAMLGEMLASVAHELNTPIGFISANLSNLSKFIDKIFQLLNAYEHYASINSSNSEKIEIDKIKKEINYDYLKARIPEMMVRSMKASDSLKTLIRDVKISSRADSSKAEPSDINEALESAVHIIMSEYKSKVKINKDYDKLPLVECYIGKLNQVFLNILSNSCEAIEGTGEITVRTRHIKETVTIEITDTGSGMSDKVLEKIFLPFFTTKAIGYGTGLGLSISHRIIEQHGGTLSADSKLGQGTKFTIKLPICQKQQI